MCVCLFLCHCVTPCSVDNNGLLDVVATDGVTSTNSLMWYSNQGAYTAQWTSYTIAVGNGSSSNVTAVVGLDADAGTLGKMVLALSLLFTPHLHPTSHRRLCAYLSQTVCKMLSVADPRWVLCGTATVAALSPAGRRT
jgi:hypothetical protein